LDSHQKIDGCLFIIINSLIMYRLTIFLLLFLMISITSLQGFGQVSFSYLVKTPDDEIIFDGAEDELGNYYMVGRKVTANPFTESAYLLVLNNDGELVYENEFYNEDSSSYFGSVYYKNDSIIIFGVRGSTSVELMDDLWVLILDGDFNVLKSKTFNLNGYNIGDLESIINHKGNYVICGLVDTPQEEPDIFFYEISSLGDSIKETIILLEGIQMEFDLIEKQNGGYKVFAYGYFPNAPNSLGKIVEFDSLYNYISADSIPNKLWSNHTAKWLNESCYLVSGNKPVNNPIRKDIGIIKLNDDDDFITGNQFGKTGDTISYAGSCSNFDFISSNEIFFGGASNIIPQQGIYQIEDSWLLLNNLDSNLNLNWQRFYGGDAAYYLWGLKATQDGGCLMMATRYDADIQDHELDIFILKVDSNGLLTSTGDFPSIPVQQLAIFPNPSRDIISIRYPDIFGYDYKEIIIFNSVGNEVKHISATHNLTETRFDISDLPVGLYFAVLNVDGEKVATWKFLVVR
jgi:hypothetical protein